MPQDMPRDERSTRAKVWVLAALAVLLVIGVGAFRARRRTHKAVSATNTATPPAKRPVSVWLPVAVPRAPSETTLSGHVQRKDGIGISGATVALFREAHPSSSKVALPGRLVRTDAAGAYHVDGLVAGAFRVSASARGFAAAGRSGVRVVDQHDVEDIDIVLEPGGVPASGTVSDAGGGPIAGATVSFASLDELRGPWIASATTDGSGRYELSASDALASARATADGYGAQTRRVSINTASSIDFVLSPGARIEGRVVEQGTTRACPKAEIIVWHGGLDYEAISAQADEDGRFTSPVLPPNQYSLFARLGSRSALLTKVAVRSTETTSVLLELQNGPIVEGHVRDDQGAPISGARVYTEQPPGASAETDPTGHYRLLGLAFSSPTLRAVARDYAEVTSSVMLNEAKLYTADFTLRTAGRVEGNVVNEEGAPVPHVSVHLEVKYRNGFRSAEKADAPSDETGSFLISHASVEANQIAAIDPFGLKAESTLIIKPGSVTRVTLQLPSAGRVVGSVKWTNGQPAEGILVRGYAFHTGVHAVTDRDGRFTLDRVKTGDQKLTAIDPAAVAVGAEDTKTVEVSRSGPPVEVNFVLRPRRGRLSGVVEDQTGVPIDGAQVRVVEASRKCGLQELFEEGVPGEAVTTAGGRFEIVRLPEQEPLKVCASEPAAGRGEINTVTAGATDLRIRLSRSAPVRILVTDRQAQPVATESVTAKRATDEWFGVTGRPTGRRGEFVMDELEPGVYAITAQASDGAQGRLDGITLPGDPNAPVHVVVSEH